ncbi:MAG: AAA family ATPase [Campylobacterota bacterium]|nr:AAA family ATPase [Campylobacterota bacterium]
MKINKVTLENINSLQGKHTIDFKDNFSDHGLFLISGETGSGKSTILDAICIALYGRTPRLKGASETKQLISTSSLSCYSEVEFEVDGVLYKSYWGLDRVSRGKNKGDIKDSVMHLSVYKNGSWIDTSTRKMDLSKKIENITNLNFDRFIKTVMLAQGSFDAFLKADKNEKSEILEKITGTQIYQKISQKVYEKHKIKLEELKKLQDKIDESKTLTDEQLKQKDEEISLNKTKHKELSQELKQIQNILVTLTNIEKYNNEIKKLEDDTKNIEDDKKAFVQKQLKLDIALKSKEIYSKIIDKENLVSENKTKQNELQQLELKIAKSKQQLSSLKIELEKSTKEIQLFKIEYDKKIITIQKARELITTKELKSEQFEKIKDDLKGKEKISNIKIEDNTKIEDYINENNVLLKNLKIKQDENSLEKLYEDKNKIKIKIQNLIKYLKLQDEIVKTQKEIELNINKLDKSSVVLKANEKEIEELEKKLINLKEHQFNISKIKDYAKDRINLKDDQECYLCGSKQHPYTLNLPNIEDNLQDDIDKYSLKKDELSLKNKQEIKNNTKLSTTTDFLKSSLKKSKDDIENLKELKDTKKDILEKELNSIESKIKELVQVDKDITKYTKQKEQLENKKEIIMLSNIVEKSNDEIKRITNQIDELLEKKDIELFKKEIEDKKSNLEKTQDSLKKQQIDLNTQQTKNDTNINNTIKHIEQISDKLINLNNVISNMIKEKGFIDEDDVKKGFIKDENIIKNIISEKEKLQSRDTKTTALLKNIKDKLELELKKDIDTTKDKKILLETENILNKDKDLLIETITLIENEIKQSIENKKNQELIYGQIKQKKTELEVWETLNNLIGSAKGTSYQVFVQNLTLGHLLKLANSHLKYLNNRYTLAKQNDENLTISIVDSYYFGQIRGTNTLSGGEGFLVSLALALGLSDLVNDRIKVDSLFLDEGFGTLDEDTLNTAIDALEKLHLKGKTIGIISHVELLKERITAQIRLKKSANGYSNLEVVGTV